MAPTVPHVPERAIMADRRSSVRAWAAGGAVVALVVAGGVVVVAGGTAAAAVEPVAVAAAVPGTCNDNVDGGGDGAGNVNSCQSASQGTGGAESVNACNGNVDGGGDGDGNVNSCQTSSQGDITIVNVPPPMGGQSTAISGKRFATNEEQATLPKLPDSKTIGTLDLPAGSYFISALVSFPFNLTLDPAVTCDLVAEGDVDRSQVNTDIGVPSAFSTEFPGVVALPLETVHTFGAPGQVAVSCSDLRSDTDVNQWNSVRISVIQVASTQPPAVLGGE